VHERYNQASFDFDIAVLRLPRVLSFNASVQPVCLPSSPAATNCVVAGWNMRGKHNRTFGLSIIYLQFYTTALFVANKRYRPNLAPLALIVSELFSHAHPLLPPRAWPTLNSVSKKVTRYDIVISINIWAFLFTNTTIRLVKTPCFIKNVTVHLWS